MGRVALDGSKIKANSALEDNRTLSHLLPEVRERSVVRSGDGGPGGKQDGRGRRKPPSQDSGQKGRAKEPDPEVSGRP